MEEVYKYLEPIFEGQMEKKHIRYGKNTALENFKGWCFVYILISNDIVVYIGSTQCIQNRLHDHKYSKEFDTVFLAAFNNKDEMLFAEKLLLNRYRPKLNKKLHTYSLDMQLNYIKYSEHFGDA